MVAIPVSIRQGQRADGVDPRAELQGVVDRLLAGERRITALDAGCGSGIHIRLSRNARVVGIDICQTRLAGNPFISQRILGDIQHHDVGEERFDLVMCWDVLEHLPEPEKALRSFVRAAKMDGAILLALPNIYSLKGLIAKFTPHRFHIWVYRGIFKSRNAGKPGYPPFPTFLRPAISPRALKRFAAENNLREEYFRLYEGPAIKKLESGSPLLYAVYKLTLVLLKLASLGAYDGSKSDLFVVFRRRAMGRPQSAG